MTLEVLTSFKIRANGKEVTLQPGQRIRVKEEIAERLLAEGKVRRIGDNLRGKEEAPEKTSEGVRENTRELSDEELRRKLSENKFAPVRIYSRLLDDTLWLVWDEAEMKQLIAKGIREAIYTANEISILRNKSKEHLEAVHRTKKVFPGAIAKA